MSEAPSLTWELSPEDEAELQAEFVRLDSQVPVWAQNLPPESGILDIVRREQAIAKSETNDTDVRDFAEIKLTYMEIFHLEQLELHKITSPQYAICMQTTKMQEAISDNLNFTAETVNELLPFIEEVFCAYSDHYKPIAPAVTVAENH